MVTTATSTRSKKSEIPSQPITSVAHFLQKLSERFDGNDGILFRGQRDIAWPLMPRLGRIQVRAKYPRELAQVEAKMLADFERLAVLQVRSKQLQSSWEVLALATHHGLPTRLLDWSSNPLVALWFAVHCPPTSGSSAVVWAFDASEDDLVDISKDKDPFSLSVTKIFRPHHHDERIVAQAGWFTVQRYAEAQNTFSTFERIKTQRVRLSTYVIAPKNFAPIREELARCGISRASLFPDLAGLCQHLTWKYEMLDDEFERDIATLLG